MLDPVDDPLPAAIRARHGLRGLDAALRAMHEPRVAATTGTRPGSRLKWDEALGVQLALAQRRAAAAAQPGHRPSAPDRRAGSPPSTRSCRSR